MKNGPRGRGVLQGRRSVRGAVQAGSDRGAGFTDEQILAQIDAALEEDRAGRYWHSCATGELTAELTRQGQQVPVSASARLVRVMCTGR